MNQHLRSIVILGTREEAMLSAACLSKALEKQGYDITLVELAGPDSEENAALAAEATIAPLRAFHTLMGIDESGLVRASNAMPYLGTLMSGWGGRDAPADFVQTFSEVGRPIGATAFHHCVTWLRSTGENVSLEDFNFAAQAARAGRIARPVQESGSLLSSFTYGLNLDLTSYADVLRAHVLAQGVRIVPERAVIAIADERGRIGQLQGASGARYAGELFIDASGPGAVLMRQTLGAAFEPVSGLGTFRIHSMRQAIAPSHAMNVCTLRKRGYRTAIAFRDHQVLNHIQPGNAADEDMPALAAGAATRSREFVSGRLDTAWRGNCIAIGEAAGVLEPLGASRLHRTQVGLTHLLGLFPDQRFYPSLIEAYNRLMSGTFDRQADVVLAHYALSGRVDEWQWPETLTRQIRQFRSRGRVVISDDDFFDQAEWVSLFLGMGLRPERYDPLIDGMDRRELRQTLRQLQALVQRTVAAMPALRAS